MLLQGLPGVCSVVQGSTQNSGRWTLGLADGASQAGGAGLAGSAGPAGPTNQQGLAHTTAAVLQALAAAGLTVRHLETDRANLEDVFLALTGRQLRD